MLPLPVITSNITSNYVHIIPITTMFLSDIFNV